MTGCTFRRYEQLETLPRDDRARIATCRLLIPTAYTTLCDRFHLSLAYIHSLSIPRLPPVSISHYVPPSLPLWLFPFPTIPMLGINCWYNVIVFYVEDKRVLYCILLHCIVLYCSLSPSIIPHILNALPSLFLRHLLKLSLPIGSFRVNSTNFCKRSRQVSVSNITQNSYNEGMPFSRLQP